MVEILFSKPEEESMHIQQTQYSPKLAKGRIDIIDSAQRNPDKPGGWASKRKLHTWSTETPHLSTFWEQTADLLERVSSGKKTLTEPNLSQQQREQQSSKAKLQLWVHIGLRPFPQGTGSAAVQWAVQRDERSCTLEISKMRQSLSWHNVMLSRALLWWGGWTRYPAGVPESPQVCDSNPQEPFTNIPPYLKTFSLSKVLCISQEKSIFTSDLSRVRDFLMQIQLTSAKTKLVNYFKVLLWKIPSGFSS